MISSIPLEIHHQILNYLDITDKLMLKKSCKSMLKRTVIACEEILKKCYDTERCMICYSKDPVINVKELGAYLCPCLITKMISFKTTRTGAWNVIYKDPSKNHYTNIAVDFREDDAKDYSAIHQSRQAWLDREIIQQGLLKKDLLSSSLSSLRSRLSAFVHQNFEMKKEEQMEIQNNLMKVKQTIDMKIREQALLKQLDHHVSTSTANCCPVIDYTDLPQCFHDYVQSGKVSIAHCLGDCHSLAVVEGHSEQCNERGRMSMPTTKNVLSNFDFNYIASEIISDSIKVVSPITKHPILILTNHVYNQVIHANYVKTKIKMMIKNGLHRVIGMEEDKHEVKIDYIQELVISAITKECDGDDVVEMDLQGFPENLSAKNWSETDLNGNILENESDLTADYSQSEAVPDVTMAVDEMCLTEPKINQTLDSNTQIFKKKLNSKFNWGKIESLVNSAITIVIDRERREKEDKDKFQQFSLSMLEQRLKIKAPTVFLNMGSSMEFCADFRYAQIVNGFMDISHQNCSRHFTVCIDFVISDLVNTFRSIKCEESMVFEMRKYIPDFEPSMLTFSAAIERYQSSTASSFWMHVPVNATRVFQAEIIGRHLARLFPDIKSDTFTPTTKSLISKFIVSEHDPLPPLLSNSSNLPMTNYLDLCLSTIWRIERNRLNRRDHAVSRLKALGIEQDEDLVNSWIYTLNLSLQVLEDHLGGILDSRRRDARMSILKDLIIDSDIYKALFACEQDEFIFSTTPQFKLCIFSSRLSKFYLKGDKRGDLTEAVFEVGQIIRDLIHNRIDAVVVLAVMPLFRLQ